MKNKKHWIIIGVIALAVISVLILNKKKDKGTRVAAEPAQQRTIVQSVNASGKLLPKNEVKVNSDATGEVTAVLVTEGSTVNKGQLLATIKGTASSFKGISGDNPLEALSAMSAPKTVTKIFNVYAPISGTISKINIKQGERVGNTLQMGNAELMRIADISTMRIDVEIGENDIQKLHIGDSVYIDVDAYAREKFIGFVTKIAQSNTSNSIGGIAGMGSITTDQASNYAVSIEMDKTSYQPLMQKLGKFPFKSGMSANAEILTQHIRDVITVPINAVTTRELNDSTLNEDQQNDLSNIKEYVFVVDASNKVKLTEVQTSAQDNKYIQITKGLQPNDKVVYYPYSAVANTLQDKDKVIVVDKKTLFKEMKKED